MLWVSGSYEMSTQAQFKQEERTMAANKAVKIRKRVARAKATKSSSVRHARKSPSAKWALLPGGAPTPIEIF